MHGGSVVEQVRVYNGLPEVREVQVVGGWSPAVEAGTCFDPSKPHSKRQRYDSRNFSIQT
eukprot:831754-Amorphochlora_amoeboformis.AAC.1